MVPRGTGGATEGQRPAQQEKAHGARLSRCRFVDVGRGRGELSGIVRFCLSVRHRIGAHMLLPSPFQPPREGKVPLRANGVVPGP